MSEPLPTDFNTFPTDFVVQLLIPSIVLFGVVILLVFIAVPVTCCTAVIDKRIKIIITTFCAVAGLILWTLALNGFLGGYFDELLNLIEDAFDIVNEVKGNLDEVETCLGNFTDGFDLGPINDIETEFNKHKKTAEKWHRIIRIILISCYSVLITTCVVFPVFVYRSIKVPKIIITCVVALILFIVFIVMVPVSNGGYSGLRYVCGTDISGHNEKVNKLIATFDDSVTEETFCEHKTWQYLCDLQTCNSEEQLLGEFFNLTELEEANVTQTLLNGCQYQTVYNLIETTLEETLGCDNLQGLYNNAIDNVLCTEFQNLFVYTLWPVGLGTIFTIIMLTVGFLKVNDYLIVKTSDFII